MPDQQREARQKNSAANPAMIRPAMAGFLFLSKSSQTRPAASEALGYHCNAVAIKLHEQRKVVARAGQPMKANRPCGLRCLGEFFSGPDRCPLSCCSR